MPTLADLDSVIARQLKIPRSAVRDDLAFGTSRGWDSLAHVELMTAIESVFGFRISDDDMVELTSVGAIRAFVAHALAGR